MQPENNQEESKLDIANNNLNIARSTTKKNLEPTPKLNLRHAVTMVMKTLPSPLRLSNAPSLIAQTSSVVSHKLNENSLDEEKGSAELLTQVNILSTGASFGELALLSHKPRAATIICREDCDFAVLEKEDFVKILKYSEEKKLLEEMNFFASLVMFKGWNFNLVKMLYVNTFIKSCYMNEIIYQENDESEEMFVVEYGTFVVKKTLILQNNHNIKKWGGMKDLFANNSKYVYKEIVKVCIFINIFTLNCLYFNFLVRSFKC